MTDGVRTALATPSARHSSATERTSLADGDEQADFGRTLLAPKKGASAQSARERHLDSEGLLEKRWQKLAERLAETQSGEAGAKSEADAISEILAAAGDQADAAQPPLGQPDAKDPSQPDAAEGAALPLVLALSELRKAGSQPNAPTSSGTSSESVDQAEEASGETPAQRAVIALANAATRSASAGAATPATTQAAPAAEVVSEPSGAPQLATASATRDVAAAAEKASRPAAAKQPEQAVAASRVTVISEQAIPAPATSGTGTTAGTLALDIGSETLRHTAAASAVQQLQATAQNGSAAHVLKIQLRPVELGMVTASLHLAGDQLSVEIQVENAEAYHRLSADRETINSALRGLGFDVDRVTIQQPQAQTSAQSRNDGGSFSSSSGGREQPAFQSGGTGGEGSNSGNGRTAGRAANEDGNARNISSPGAGSSGSSLYI
ncbi:flagellar hook-length control protein FliK [Mesorhizobium sp. ANAO-SY3R2]|uniref:flagellar hook-length control protein FliK n=1 Tax=Mesorhizobium sp. ANAO-SY3R2 TaxID=3166644 RepID=UPI0036721D2F